MGTDCLVASAEGWGGGGLAQGLDSPGDMVLAPCQAGRRGAVGSKGFQGAGQASSGLPNTRQCVAA